MTESELRRLCRWWQKVLRLQDWVVAVDFTRRYDISPGIGGDCDWNLHARWAAIRILDPRDADPKVIEPFDPEFVLLHELLHLHFAPFSCADKDSPQQIAQEQAINAIAQALVRLKRKGGRAQ